MPGNHRTCGDIASWERVLRCVLSAGITRIYLRKEYSLEMEGRSMWPQAEDLPGSQKSQPPLARSYASVSVIYCQIDRDDQLDFSPGSEQLEWWHMLCMVCSKHLT